MPAGERSSEPATRPSSGQIAQKQAPPASRILAIPLMKFINPSRPKSRSKPFMGDNLARLGFQPRGAEHRAVLDDVAGEGGEHHQADGRREHRDQAIGGVFEQRRGVARVDDDVGRVLQEDAEIRGKALNRHGAEHREREHAALESMMRELSSALLTTSPLRWASSSLRCVGSSVFCELSRSSATAHPKRLIWSAKKSRNLVIITPITSIRRTKPERMFTGMARKKTWSCGIRRESTPRAA